MPPSPAAYRPSTRHGELGPDFYDIVEPAVFPEHVLRFRNRRWAARVGLDGLSDDEWIRHFGRFEPLPGSFERPLALRYHGHQFRTYNPYLGDGRGFLFAQLHDVRDGRLLDLATKGSGKTPWSRHADGRLTLKGGVREILATEMLEALGVETSKTFSLIETGEALERGDEPSPTRSSVLVRLSHSHIRIGTFQRFLYLDEVENIRKTSRLHGAHLHAGSLAGDRAGAGRILSRGGLPSRRTDGRAMDGGRFRAWRAQHGQHQRHGRKLRLRALAFPARTTTRTSRPPISTRRAFMPSAASPTRCSGTSFASPSACSRSRRRSASKRP